MAEFDINMNEVNYKPPLDPGQYTFVIVKAEPAQAKNVNARSGVREWYIGCELKPLEKPDYTVFHNWSLSNQAIATEDAVISLKKLYEVMNFPAGTKVNTNDLLQFKFAATTKLEEYNGRLSPRLDKILEAVN